MLFAYRLLKNILCFLLIQLPLQIASGIILLAYLPFHRTKIASGNYSNLKLPNCIKWFDNADIYIGRDSFTYLWVCRQSFWVHYNWLVLRNPINYFEYLYLGFQFLGYEFYTIHGSMNVGDSTGREEGFKIIELDNGTYEYLYVKKAPWNAKACFYFRMGWKIGNYANPRGSWCQHVFTISYRSYSGV